jgi:serine/threonine-protein kinase
MGVHGTIALAGKSIELRPGNAAPVSIDIEVIVNQWPLLPADMRQRKAEEIARRLVGAARLSRQVEGRREIPLDANARGPIVGGIVGFFGLLVVIGAARYFIPRFTSDDKAEPRAPTEDDGARTDRLARACDAVRDRIYKGSTFGPFALEGFAVELWLARKDGPPLKQNAAVTALLDGKKLAASADDKLAGIIDGTLEIGDGFDAAAAGRSPGWNAVSLVLTGGYARAFFQEDQRPRFLGLADRVAAASGATHGALYARCAHLRTHDVGVWFRGPDLAGASASLVYQMGFFSEAKMLDRAAIAAVKVPAGAGEIAALTKAASDVETSIPSIIGNAGGSVTAGKPTTLIFALTAPVRAIGAARDLSRRMGVGVQSSE